MSAPLENLLRDARLDLILGRIESDPSVINEVINSLDSKIRSVKFNAILILGKLGTNASSALAKLTACLEDNDFGICRETIKSIGSMGNIAESSVSGISKLITHKQAAIRREIAVALGNIEYTSDIVISTLLTALKDPEEDVRTAAANALGHLKSSSTNVLSALAGSLRDNHWRVRAASATALGLIGSTDNNCIANLITQLNDSDWRVRYKIIDALTNFGEKAIPELVVALNTMNYLVKKSVIEVLGEINTKNQDVINALAPFALSRKEALRGKSITSLSNIGAPAMPQLLTAIKKASSSGKGLRILIALGLIPGLGTLLGAYSYFYTSNGILGAFLSLLGGMFLGTLAHSRNNSPANERRSAILSGIGSISDDLKELIPEIVKTLGELNLLTPYYQVKVKSEKLSIGGKIRYAFGLAYNTFMAFLEDPFRKKANVRVELCRTLGKIGQGSPLAVSVLVEKLSDNKDSVRRGAALALGKIGPFANTAIPNLINILKDRKPDVRWRAAEALGRIAEGTPQVISALEERLYDKYDHVSAQAEFSLELIKEKQS